ncbi:hypothetical protein CEXT_597881 [Caerostris extrusa]|uniref:Uncharacterized protein n=1 Tax=Caerostris extrusa TaxID=172846 RepID=A0AAV4UC45_CAEEX|nr:hypothetical protein CEXT_597881 [Caerostris extrusa]
MQFLMFTDAAVDSLGEKLSANRVFVRWKESSVGEVNAAIMCPITMVYCKCTARRIKAIKAQNVVKRQMYESSNKMLTFKNYGTVNAGTAAIVVISDLATEESWDACLSWNIYATRNRVEISSNVHDETNEIATALNQDASCRRLKV